jgi:AP-2 complex subunit sigma-1
VHGLRPALQTRLAKYYMPLSDPDKARTEDEVYRLIANRDAKFTNFLEVRAATVAEW